MSGLKYFSAVLLAVLLCLTLTSQTVFAENHIPNFEEFMQNIQKAEEHFNRGNSYFKAKQYDEAVNEFTQAIEIKNDSPEYYVARGKAYLHVDVETPSSAIDSLIHLSQENYDKAEKDFDTAIQLDENFAEAYSMRAALYAIQSFKEGDLPEGYFQEGMCFYYTNDDYREAISYFDLAIFYSKDSDKDRIYCMRGRAYHKLKNPNAIEDFSKAIEIDASHAEYYENRAMAYYDFEQYQNALNDFNELIKFDEKYKELYKEEIWQCHKSMIFEIIETYVGKVWLFALLILSIFGWCVLVSSSGTLLQDLKTFLVWTVGITTIIVLINVFLPPLKEVTVPYFLVHTVDTIIQDLRGRGHIIPNWIDQPLQSIKAKLSQRFGGNRNP